MNIEIPLSNVANQKVSVILNSQDVTIELRSFNNQQYATVSVKGRALCENVALADRIPVVKYKYLGFVGDIYSVDLLGRENPTDWSRFKLFYSDEI